MAKRQNSGKLTAKPAATAPAGALSVPSGDGTVEFPDAVAYIRSLGEQRQGIEWNIRVYKIDGHGRGNRTPQQFLYEIDPEEVPKIENRLAEEHPGGGSFKIVVRADNEIVRSALMDIAPRPGWKPPPPAWQQQQEQQSAGTNHMEMFFSRMMEMQERSAQQTRELIAALAKPVAQPTMMEQLALFTEFQKLAPKGAQENTMEMFQKGMDFASKLFEARGGEGGGTSWLDVLKEALASPAMKEILAAAARPQPAHQAQLEAPQQFVHPNNPIAANAIDTLLRQAQNNIDPKVVAQQAFNNLPPAVLMELEAQDDVVGYIIANFPQAAQHKAWLTKVVAEMWEPEQSAAGSPALQNNARPATATQPPQA
jgi:hypothetical protein